MQPATLERIRAGGIAKGDVLTVADVGAVMAAKRTSGLIPMCHSLALTGVDVEFGEIIDAGRRGPSSASGSQPPRAASARPASRWKR